MIVYGDPQFESRYLAVIDALTERVAQVDPGNIDELRTLLVQAGQLERAIERLGEMLYWNTKEEKPLATAMLILLKLR